MQWGISTPTLFSLSPPVSQSLWAWPLFVYYQHLVFIVSDETFMICLWMDSEFENHVDHSRVSINTATSSDGYDYTSWKWKLLSGIQLFAIPWTIQSMEFSRPEYWSGWLFPSPGDLHNPGIKPRSPALQVDSSPSEPPGKPRNTNTFFTMLIPPTLHKGEGTPPPAHMQPPACPERSFWGFCIRNICWAKGSSSIVLGCLLHNLGPGR